MNRAMNSTLWWTSGGHSLTLLQVTSPQTTAYSNCTEGLLWIISVHQPVVILITSAWASDSLPEQLKLAVCVDWYFGGLQAQCHRAEFYHLKVNPTMLHNAVY